MHPQTSDLRVALCAAICTAVYRADPATKRRLADALEALPFQSMGDRALVDMAREYVDPTVVDRYVKAKSPARYDVVELALCHVCRDSNLVEVEPGRFGFCPNCRRVEEPA